MKRYTRLLSLLLTVSMLLSMALIPVQAAEEDGTVTGSISVTLRIDYAQTLSALAERNIQMELRRNGTALGQVALSGTYDGLLKNTYPVQVRLRDVDGGDLTGEGWPGFADVTVQALPQGSYELVFTGVGYRSFSQRVDLGETAQHLILGTADDTFTLGDLDGDGKVNTSDRKLVSDALGTDAASCDLNGDGKVDIVDLAYVTRNASGIVRGTLGTAELRDTYLLAPPVDQAVLKKDLEQTCLVQGDLSDLFSDNGKSVRIQAKDNDAGTIDLPITLTRAETLEEIQIVSTEARKGTVTVEYEDGSTEELPFDYTLPEGIRAISRSGDEHVITIKLGNRVAVKKVTISVTKTETGFVTLESVQFLKEIVPETPVASNNQVKNLTAVAGSEKVDLTWSGLRNVTGYTVSYFQTAKPTETREVRVDRSSATISGLEDLKEYTFIVTPIADGWVGKPVDIKATPEPTKAPSAPDMVTVTELDGALRLSWKASKGATYYKVYYAEGDTGFRQLEGSLSTTNTNIAGLKNGTTYSVYVVSGNSAGESGPSRVYQGTPMAVSYERPAGIPTEGVLDYTAIDKIWLAAEYNVSPTEYSSENPFKPENMADGDYSTHWTAHPNWWNSKQVLCTFKQPQDISSVIWVPRLDGSYASNLRVYTVTVWQEGDDLNGPGHVVAPNPAHVDASQVNNWLPVKGNPSVSKFAVLPIEPTKNVVKLAVTIEQQAYTTVSLSELMFLEYDETRCLPDQIDALFADELHLQLAASVNQAEIDVLRARLVGDEKNYYLNLDTMEDELKLAEELLAGTSQGAIINGIDSCSAAADSAKYSQSGSELQPLGVAAKAGQTITVYASGIPDGQTVQVHASQFNAEASTWRASMGTLQNGKNILVVPKIGSQNTSRGGSLYLTYSGTDAENIRLHIRRATDIPLLELSDWYEMTEDARRTEIAAYVDELIAYPGKAGVNSANEQTYCLNVTELSLPGVLLSLPAQSVLTGTGYTAGSGREAMVDTLYNNVLAWEDVMHICKTTQGIDRTYAQNDMTSRQNIRCMQMFAGAFMYAAGNHIGIGYGSCAGMVRGKPIEQLPEGAAANQLFGWGIAHEIGHNMDKLGRAEITNNLYSLMVQTYDGGANVLPSRLELSGKYDQIFTKVAQGYPGASNDVFVQLGMYWQLHLAYDDAGDPMGFYNRFFKAWKAGTYTQGTASYDDKVALTASGVAGKDLTEFFTRWGMTLSDSTKTQLSAYGKDSRAIWYLTDASRRARLEGTAGASGSISATAAMRAETNNEVVISVNTSQLRGTVQGYEIVRNGVPIAFSVTPEYTDVIGTANHKTYAYQVRAYDILGNLISTADAGELRVAYDVTVDPGSYTVSRNGDDVIFTMQRETAVSGIKLVGGAWPTEGDFTVSVTDSGNQTTVAKRGRFSENQAVDDQNSFLSYFNKPGASNGDTRIWTYDAVTITVTGIPADVEASDVLLVSYAGDDVSLLEGAFAGRLAEAYTYGPGAGDVIPAGTLVIAGYYRGDPVYNYVKIKGRFTTTTFDEEETVHIDSYERYLDGDCLMFAEIPEDGAVSDISDGIFLFIPNVQNEAALQEATHCDGVNLLPSMIRAEIFRTDMPEDTSSGRSTAETLWVSAPGGEDLPIVVLEDGNP